MVKNMIIISGGTVDIEWLRSMGPSCFFSEENRITDNLDTVSFDEKIDDKWPDCKVMAADKGLLYAKEAGIPVDYILGDFDSLPEELVQEYGLSEEMAQEYDLSVVENSSDKESPQSDNSYKKMTGINGVKIRIYPPEKDYTDTHLAFLWAMEEGAENIYLIGGMGTRFDHSFANVGLLSVLLEHGVHGEIIDPYNRIFMMDGKQTVKLFCKEGYISLIPYTEKVTGITLNGFKYPLEQATLTLGISRGISNELLGEEGTIQIENGMLIVSISRDEADHWNPSKITIQKEKMKENNRKEVLS